MTTEAKVILGAKDESAPAWASWRNHVTGAQTQLTGFQAVMATAIGAAPVVAFTTGMSRAIGELDRLGDQAPKVGLTAQSLGELGFAAKLSATNSEALEGALGKLSSKVGDAVGGNKEAIATFKALGIQVTDAGGKVKASDQLFGELADRFSTFEDGPLKTALAIDVFGKSGKEMLPMLDQGSAGIAALREEYVRLNGGPISDAAEQAAQWRDNMDKLATKSQGFFMHIAGEVLPLTNLVAEAFLEVGLSADGAAEGTEHISTAAEATRVVLETLVIVGANVAYVFKAAVNEIGAIAAQLAALGRGDLEGFKAISQAVKADAERARAELDRFQERVLNAKTFDKIKKAAAEAEKATEGGRQQAPVLPKDTPAAEVKDKETEYEKLIKRINEKIDAEAAEIEAGRELTAFEKFRLKSLADMNDARKNLTESEKGAVITALWEAEASDKAITKLRAQIAYAKELATQRQQQRNADYEAVQRYIQDQRDQANARVAALREANEALAEEVSTIGLSEQALAQRVQALNASAIAQKQATLADLEARDVGHDRQQELRNEIELLQQRQQLLGAKGAAQQVAALAEEVKRFNDDIYQGLSDALQRAFEDGERFGAGMFNSLVALGKKTTIQVGVKGVGNLLSGQDFFSGTLANNSTLLPGLSNLGFGSGSSIFTRFAGSSMGESLGLSSAVDAIGGLDTATTALTSAGEAFAAAAPWAAAALLVANSGLFDGGGGPKQSTGYGYGISASEQYGGAATAMVQELQTTFAALTERINGVASTLQAGLFYSTDPAGDAQTQLQVAGAVNGRQVYARSDRGLGGINGIENVGRSAEELQAAIAEDTARLMLAAIQATELSPQMRAIIGATDAYASSLGDVQSALARVNTAADLQERLYQLTASDADKLARTRDRERAATDAANLSLLEAIYAQEDLASSSTALAQATAEAARTQERIEAERLGLQKQLWALEGNTAALRAAELAALDPANRALQEHIWALQKVADLADQAAQAQDKYNASIADAQDFIAGVGLNIRQYLDQLNSTDAGLLPRDQQLANARKAYQEQLALARSGDRNALGSITQYFDALVAASKAYSASGGDTQTILAQGRIDLAALPGQISPEQLIVDAITSTAGATQQQIALLTSSVVAQLKTGFEQLDTTADGLLSRDEFLTGLAGQGSNATLAAIFATLDANGDGQLSRLEALASTSTNQLSEAVKATASLDAIAFQQRQLGDIWLRVGGLIDVTTDVNNSIQGMWTHLHNDLGTISNQIAQGITVRSEIRSGGLATFARGGVFTNGVVSTPTLFDMGLMGEAGDEAIMPLARGAGGALGVRTDAATARAMAQLGDGLKRLEGLMASQLQATLRIAPQQLAAQRTTAANTSAMADAQRNNPLKPTRLEVAA